MNAESKTREQIIAQSEALASIVGTQTFTGKSPMEVNAAIEAQIEVLRNNLSEGEIIERFGQNDFILGMALTARTWATGQVEESPMDVWSKVE